MKSGLMMWVTLDGSISMLIPAAAAAWAAWAMLGLGERATFFWGDGGKIERRGSGKGVDPCTTRPFHTLRERESKRHDGKHSLDHTGPVDLV